MKRWTFAKISSLLAVMLVLSAAMPLAAYASIWFSPDESDFSYEDGNVTAAVYMELSDIGDVDAGPTLNIDEDGNVTSVTYSTYEDNGDYRYFYFNEDIGVNNFIDLTAEYENDSNATVTTDTYKRLEHTTSPEDEDDDDDNNPPTSGGGGNGGGTGGDSGSGDADDEVDNTTITVEGDAVSAEAIAEAYDNGEVVVVIISDDSVLLPADALAEAADIPGAVLTVENEHGEYALPLQAIDFTDLAEQLNVELDELMIRIEISPVDADVADIIAEQSDDIGAEQVAVATEFGVYAEAGDESVEIQSFGDTYVARTLPLLEQVNPANTTGVVFDLENAEFKFVPSVFTNGETPEAEFYRNSNSIYTVITLDKSFSDVPADHWGKADVDVLTNKLIVYGMDEDTFAPNRDITRAEFAGLLVRSLGLGLTEASETFSDVSEDDWFSTEVAIAAQAGLIFGYEDGTFRPNRVITREELAAMVVRAANYAGADLSVTEAEQDQLLAQYDDRSAIGWGHEEMAAAVDANIVYGMSEDTLAPKQHATRVQATAMLKRYLDHVGFIN